jgi:DNA-binding transcriptional ArsR family regulator
VWLVPNTGEGAADLTQDSGNTSGKRPPTLQEARALAHPLRLRILRVCLDQARTNSELATALGQKPATMLYHVRTLLRTGFLAEEPTRPGPRGTVEKPYRATGKSWQMQRSGSPEERQRLRAVFEALAAEVDDAGPDSVLELARLAVRLRPEQVEDLRAQLRALIAQFPVPPDYLAQNSSGTDPYAMLLVLHRRVS